MESMDGGVERMDGGWEVGWVGKAPEGSLWRPKEAPRRAEMELTLRALGMKDTKSIISLQNKKSILRPSIRGSGSC